MSKKPSLLSKIHQAAEYARYRYGLRWHTTMDDVRQAAALGWLEAEHHTRKSPRNLACTYASRECITGKATAQYNAHYVDVAEDIDEIAAKQVSREASQETIALLVELLSKLNERERTVVYMRWAEGYTYQEIGEYFGVTKAGAHAIAKQALAKLQRIARRKNRVC